MIVLFDHNVPHKLRALLPEHEVLTADEQGWAELTNGQLLRAAEESGFQVLVTCDKNLAYQQNLTGRRLSLVVLSTNRWKILRDCAAQVAAALERATYGSYEAVEIPIDQSPASSD